MTLRSCDDPGDDHVYVCIYMSLYVCCDVCICRIYVTGFDGVGTPKKIVTVDHHSNRVKVLIPNYRDHTSMLAFVNASGQSLPPLFVFKAKQFCNSNVLSHAPPQSAFTVQPSGYFTSQMTLAVMQHFASHAISSQPLLLLLDGAKIHVELEALTWYDHTHTYIYIYTCV